MTTHSLFKMAYNCIKWELVGLSELAGFTGLLYFLFYRAFFDPSKSVTLAIDMLHEANLEAVVLLALTPLLIYSFIKIWRTIWETVN